MRKKLIKIGAWTFGVLFALFIVLAVHIYSVTKPVYYDNNDLQLARIDFRQDLDAAEASKVRSFVMAMPGVQNVMFNEHDRTLVYGYTLGQQTSENVFTSLMRSGDYKAVRFIPTEEQMASGCPMGGGNKNSFVYRASATIYHFLN